MKIDYTVDESSQFKDGLWSDYRNGFGSSAQKYIQCYQFDGVILQNDNKNSDNDMMISNEYASSISNKKINVVSQLNPQIVNPYTII